MDGYLSSTEATVEYICRLKKDIDHLKDENDTLRYRCEQLQDEVEKSQSIIEKLSDKVNYKDEYQSLQANLDTSLQDKEQLLRKIRTLKLKASRSLSIELEVEKLSTLNSDLDAKFMEVNEENERLKASLTYFKKLDRDFSRLKEEYSVLKATIKETDQETSFDISTLESNEVKDKCDFDHHLLLLETENQELKLKLEAVMESEAFRQLEQVCDTISAVESAEASLALNYASLKTRFTGLQIQLQEVKEAGRRKEEVYKSRIKELESLAHVKQ